MTDDGIVLGVFQEGATGESPGVPRGFTWQNGTITLLPETEEAMSIFSLYMNISPSGPISAMVARLDQESFSVKESPILLVDGSWQEVPPPHSDLSGVPDDVETSAFGLRGLTDSGEAIVTASWETEPNDVHALFWYQDGEYKKIESPLEDKPRLRFPVLGPDGTLLARAYPEDSDVTADSSMFLWSGDDIEDVTTLFLADESFEFRAPRAINRNGQILVRASNTDESPHGLILSRA